MNSNWVRFFWNYLDLWIWNQWFHEPQRTNYPRWVFTFVFCIHQEVKEDKIQQEMNTYAARVELAVYWSCKDVCTVVNTWEPGRCSSRRRDTGASSSLALHRSFPEHRRDSPATSLSHVSHYDHHWSHTTQHTFCDLWRQTSQLFSCVQVTADKQANNAVSCSSVKLTHCFSQN